MHRTSLSYSSFRSDNNMVTRYRVECGPSWLPKTRVHQQETAQECRNGNRLHTSSSDHTNRLNVGNIACEPPEAGSSKHLRKIDRLPESRPQAAVGKIHIPSLTEELEPWPRGTRLPSLLLPTFSEHESSSCSSPPADTVDTEELSTSPQSPGIHQSESTTLRKPDFWETVLGKSIFDDDKHCPEESFSALTRPACRKRDNDSALTAQTVRHDGDGDSTEEEVNYSGGDGRGLQCEICRTSFKNKDLRMKPYGCSYPNCQSRFAQRNALTQHVNVVHLKLRNYQCRYCQKLTGDSSNHRKHEKRCEKKLDIAQSRIAKPVKRF